MSITPKRHLTPADIKEMIQKYEQVMLEYADHGRVKTVTCQKCGELLEIAYESEKLWMIVCPCGFWHETAKGI